MDVTVRSDATQMLKEHRRALARRPEAIRRVLLAAGREYQREVVTRYMSGRGGATAGLSEHSLSNLVKAKPGATPEQIARATRRARTKQIGIARARLDTNPLTAGRTMGLNRRTKAASMGWVVVATIEGDTIRLVVAQRVPYVRFHTDTYVPKGLPRRNPVRLPSGALWAEHMRAPELAAAIAGAGFEVVDA